MKKTLEQSVSEWLYFAFSDLEAAERVNKDQMFHHVCFHAQQAAEKSIKAILVFNGKLAPKTHSIVELFKLLPSSVVAEKGNWEEKAEFLNQFYVPSRYPDALPGSLPEGLPNVEDAQKSLELAKDFYQLALDVTELVPTEVNLGA